MRQAPTLQRPAALLLSLLTAGCFVLGAGSQVGTPVQISLPRPSDSGTPGAVLAGAVVARWYGAGSAKSVSTVITSSEPAHLTLARGRWVVEVEVPGFWAKPEQVEVGEEPLDLHPQLWPAGRVRGEFAPTANAEPPGELSVFFRPVPGRDTRSRLPVGRSVCRIEASTFQCTLPVGLLDLRFQAPGFIPRYRWEVEVAATREEQLGRMELVRGSSVLGWVVTADGSPLRDGARVELRPRGTQAIRDPAETKRAESLNRTAKISDRGFFQLDGVPPGEYVLEAYQPPLAPAITTVRVNAGETTEIANPPLLLQEPQTLAVNLAPAVDPWGEPWQLQLLQVDRGETQLRAFADQPASLDGTWRRNDVPVGRYHLKVASHNGDPWWYEELEVGASTGPIDIELPIVEVEGEVRLGAKPLSAKLWFGGRFGAVRLRAESDLAGKFSLFLPRGGEWAVHVSAEEPEVERELPKVHVMPKKGRRTAEVLLRLPDTRLAGRVVDERGGALANAIVSVLGTGPQREEPVQVRTDAKGAFVLRGLVAGPAILEAEAGGDRVADPTVVEILDNRESPMVVLVARPQLVLDGVVVSAAGPVTGAKVKVAPVGLPYIGVGAVRTDAQGRFRARLPRGATQLFVSVGAPGFAFRMLRLAVPEDRRLALGVEQSGATLVIETARPIDWTDPNGPKPIVLHGNALEGLAYLEDWAYMNGVQADSPSRSVLPFVEPGAYTVCWIDAPQRMRLELGEPPPEGCATGFLPPNGQLTLEPRSPTEDRGTVHP